MTEHYTWRIGFFLLGGAGLLTRPSLHVGATSGRPGRRHDVRTPEVAVEPAGTKNSLPSLKTPTALSLIFLAFALSLTSWPTHAWLPTYIFENFKLSLTPSRSRS